MQKGWNEWEDWTDRANSAETRPPHGLIRFMKNNMYTVQVFWKQTPWGLITHLMIRRNDESAVHSWRELQRIKNEIVGEDRIGLEVYPRESELVDQANMYHLWVLPKGAILPFGLNR